MWWKRLTSCSRAVVDVAFIAAIEAGTVQWVMTNGAEAAVGIQGYPE